MKSANRRVFMMQVVAVGGVLAATQTRAQAKLEETDAQATSLGYKHDASKVDVKKFPKYAAGQTCNNCALYQGKATDPWAGCPLFGAKQVNGKGWCSAWAKKA